MFEDLRYAEWEAQDDLPELDVDTLLARYPWAGHYFQDDPAWQPDPAWLAELDAMPSPPPDRVYLDEDRPLYERDPDTFTDAEAITRLVEVEAGIARCHAMRARLVALVAAQRPATADRPAGRPGAAGGDTRRARKSAGTHADDTARPQSGAVTSPDSSNTADDPAGSAATEAAQDVVPEDVVPEVAAVSEWLSHELQMAHPYSWTAAQDLVETSLVLTGRLTATLGLLGAGRIDYPRAHILTDLLGTCTVEVAHTVEAMVLPRAPGLTPGGLATAVRRALTEVDAAALRRRHARAARAADVFYWPTQDGMARLAADLPLPVAAACSDALGSYARAQQAGGDHRPIGQIRAEVLADLILRPWDTTRPAVTAEVTIHLSIPATARTSGTGGTSTGGIGRTGGGGTGRIVDDDAAQAELDGQLISAAQCRELLTQLDSSRLFLALHDPNGTLTAVASTAQLRRAARRRRRRNRRGYPGPGPQSAECAGAGNADDCNSRDGFPEVEGPGLRPPPSTPNYRPTRAQDRHVRTRDRSCRHFGCTRKAVHADLDHHQPHPEGKTTICNLCCYCRTHHRLKHQAPGWTRDFHPDATLTITTPTGITRTTRPPDPDTQTPWPAPAPAPAPALASAAAELPMARTAVSQTTTTATMKSLTRTTSPLKPDDDPPPF